MWESDDLVNWSDQRMIELGDTDFGCAGYNKGRIQPDQGSIRRTIEQKEHPPAQRMLFLFISLYLYNSSTSRSQSAAEASLGIRQSPRGERLTVPTFEAVRQAGAFELLGEETGDEYFQPPDQLFPGIAIAEGMLGEVQDFAGGSA